MGSLLGTGIGPRKLRIPKREFVPLILAIDAAAIMVDNIHKIWGEEKIAAENICIGLFKVY